MSRHAPLSVVLAGVAALILRAAPAAAQGALRLSLQDALAQAAAESPQAVTARWERAGREAFSATASVRPRLAGEPIRVRKRVGT